ncbi:MAG: hypothetical protein J2P52_02020 [Blastocatellia bacterium]|nr:hypothetical protein [Blastocatellia bacterium]
MNSELGKKIGIFVTIFFAAILIPYSYLSAIAGKPIAPSEFARFSRVILLAMAFHSGEKGGQRALQLFQAALKSSATTGVVKIDGRKYSYPLPQYAVRRPGMSDYYLAFVADEEWERYFKVDVPEAGWKLIDQMGATHFYAMGEAKLLITERKYLTSEISAINVSGEKATYP